MLSPQNTGIDPDAGPPDGRQGFIYDKKKRTE